MDPPGTSRPAAQGVRRAEHEVVDEQLRAPVEELRQRPRPILGLEAVLLLEPHPGQPSPLTSQFIVLTGELLLAPAEILASGKPLLARPDFVVRHPVASF